MVVVRRGIQEHLRARRKLAAVARHERHHGGQVASRAVAEEHHVVGVHVVEQRVGVQLAGHLVAVLGGLGKAVFRSAPVVHGHHASLESQRHGGAGVQVEVHGAVHPSAAMEEQDGAARVLGHLEA